MRITMNVAFIPVRGGSKSIPLKNIKPICGIPLVNYVVKAACECSAIDIVYVATDSDKIKNIVLQNTYDKLRVIGRSEESATDTASTESAMLEFAGQYNFDNIVLIQATSPLLRSEDLDRGFEIFNSDNTDSVISGVKQKRFYWSEDKNANATAVNYDVYNRPRRQDFDAYYVENGAFYITSKKLLLESGNRVAGNIKMCEMPQETFIEIDEPEDWELVEFYIKKRKQKMQRQYKMFLTDCDGVLTDGGMYYSENGDELKKFNTKDGMAFELLRKHNIITGIITGENRELVRRRAEKLHIDELFMGVKDKAAVIRQLSEKYNISTDDIVYVGDDINDIEALKLAGLGACPCDAVEVVKSAADMVLSCKGGEGVVRELAEKVIV
jgi:N-acylneuraminate cytidylyltransferase